MANRPRSHRSNLRKRIGAPVLCCAALIATACGSTVQARSSGSDRGLDAPAGSASGSESDTAAVDTSGAPGAVSGAGPAGRAAGDRAKAAATVAPRLVGKAGGVTATTIDIGFIYGTNSEAFGNAGVDGLTTGDGKAQAEALTTHVNSRGGIAGRKVVPVLFGVDIARKLANPAAMDEAVCNYMTQDHHPFAVVSYDNTSEALTACLAKGGVVQVDNYAFVDGVLARQVSGYVYLPSDFQMERAYATYVTGLAQAGFLTRATKVGVYYAEIRPANKRVLDNTIKPILARLGIPLAAEAGVQNSNFAPAVLSFRAAGVTRVLGIALSPLLFMQAAEAQQYHPLWGLNSQWGAGALLQTAAPQGQLSGSMGVGWQPYSDVDSGHNPGPVSGNETLCKKIMADAGQDASAAPTTRLFQLQTCDHIFFLQHTLTGTPEVSARQLARQVQAVGDSYPSAVSFASRFPGGRFDGAAAYRVFRYDDGCSCFVYSGPVQPT
jgi:hypothetical protein